MNHSLEFLVVLIGILIAFQLNKCSDDRTKAELIENHLLQITSECEENQKKLRLSMNRIQIQLANCDSLLEETSRRESPEKVRNFATALLDMRNVDLARNAYKVLVESGDIRYLSDYEVKRKIISMYDSFEKVEQINQSNQNLYDNHFYPYIKSNFDLINWSKLRIRSKAEEEAYYSREFANTISTYRFLLLAKERIYKAQKEEIDAYLGNLPPRE
ncbi:MAG: hypothetical protein AAF990_25180 [Bacteroidota bacterium]